MKTMASTREEMAKQVSKTLIDTALRMNVPSASARSPNIKIGTEVLLFREKQNKWIGPFRVLDVEVKMVHIHIKRGEPRHSIDKVKPYLRPDETLPVPAASPADPMRMSAETKPLTAEALEGFLAGIMSTCVLPVWFPPSLMIGILSKILILSRSGILLSEALGMVIQTLRYLLWKP